MDYFELRAILRIDTADSNFDEYIDTMLPLVIEFVQDYCGQSFQDSKGEYTFRGGLKIAIAKMIEFHMNKSGVASEGLSRQSTTYNTEYPPYIMDVLDQYKVAGGTGSGGVEFF